MKKFIVLLLLLILQSCKKEEPVFVSMENTPEEILYYVSTVPKLIVRSKPTQKSDVVDSVLKDHRIDFIEDSNINEKINNNMGKWFKVKTMNNKTGYVFNYYLQKAQITESFKDLSTFFNSENCQNIGNSFKCAKHTEEVMLKKYSDKVTRNADILKFKITTGKEIIIKDEILENESNSKHYLFINYYPTINYYIVFIQYWEGGSFILINELNGKQISIWGELTISPNNKYILSNNIDLDAGYEPNGIQIFKLTEKNNLTKIFEKELRWGAANPKWLNDNQIHITRVNLAPGGEVISLAEINIKNDGIEIIE